MASGKQSKRRRRELQASTPPPVRRGGQRRQAAPKVLLAGAALLAVLGVAAGLAASLGGGSSSASSVPTRGSQVAALPGAAEVQRLFEGIPQRGNVLGSSRAPVTMVEYVDLQCPYCQQFETQAMPDLVSRYVRSGRLKVVVRPIAFIGPDSERGRLAAIAAGQQGNEFNLVELLYFNQGSENTGWLGDEMVEQAAASIPGLDVPRLLSARNAAPVKSRAQSFDSLAQSDSVTATPTILVGKSGRTPRQVTLSSPTDERSVASAIANALS
jgi:protein-disulfide isomerase